MHSPLRTILAAAGFALITGPLPAATIHTYLIGGQSNADGRAQAADLPLELQAPQTDVAYYYASNVGLTSLAPVTAGQAWRFGPEITFGSEMADFYASSGDSVAILKYARGATDLHSDWAAGGDSTTTGDGSHYMAFQQVVFDGLAALQAANPGDTIVIEGMIWVQGEQDITDAGGTLPSAATDYGENLTAFIGDVRATFDPDLTFFFSRISDNQTYFSDPTRLSHPNYLDLRAEQEGVADSVPGAIMLDIDGPQFSMRDDELHFDAAGQQALGSAFAAAAQAVPEPSTILLMAAGLALALARRSKRP